MCDSAISPPPANSEAFWLALNAGDLDACLRLLETMHPSKTSTVLECRLAEALLHQARAADAVALCRRAAPFIASDPELLRVAAWIYSNAGCHQEAAVSYLRLVELEPGWTEGYRHASSAFASAGRAADAIAWGVTASDAAPDNPEFALHAARLLCSAGRLPEALEFIGRATVSGEAGAHLDAAELLMQGGREADAARLLRDLSQRNPHPRVFRALSAAEMLQGHWPAALAAIDQAIEDAAAVAEYRIHRARLLWRMDDLAGAAEELAVASRFDPLNPEVKRAQLSLCLASGLVTEATAIGGELLNQFPDDRAVADSVLHLLNHRLDTIDGDYVVIGEKLPRPDPAPRREHGWGAQLQAQGRVIWALMIRETRTRFGESKIGYGWALIEPVLHIGLLSATFSVLMHGQPPIGSHFFLFYYTGLIPYHVFIHASSGMSHAIFANAPLLQLPLVTIFDVIAARGLLEFATDIVVAVVLLAGFGAIGIAAQPDDLWSPSLALLVTGVFGFGVGYVNAVVAVFFRSWEKVFSQITRLLYFISGIFYVPAMMPEWVREILSWNPILHAIDWFRAGFFGSYQPHWLDRSYLAGLAILSVAAGFGLERALRRRMAVPL